MRYFPDEIKELVTPTRVVALLLLGVGFILMIEGSSYLYCTSSCQFDVGRLTIDFYANGASELISIALTVLFIDALNERRQNLITKEELLRDMEGKYNDLACRAVRELRSKKWHKRIKNRTFDLANLQGVDEFKDFTIKKSSFKGTMFDHGYIKNSKFYSCSFQGVSFEDCDIEDTTFKDSVFAAEPPPFANARLSGVDFTGCQNVTTNELEKAQSAYNITLPDGTFLERVI